FHSKANGHPLYLRYALLSLKDQGLPITQGNIARLPACPHQQIEEYYLELWRALPEESKQILYLMSACPFPWPKSGIIECLDPSGDNVPLIITSLRTVEHLLVLDLLGMQPFHSSLGIWITGLPDFELYATTMKQKALNWLHTKAPDWWRFRQEWM